MSARLARSRPALVLGAVGALGLTGCGGSVEVGTKTVKTGELESSITQQYAAQGATLTAIDCDDDIEAKVGAPISCIGRNAQNSALEIRGTVTKADGGKGAFRVRTVSFTADGTRLAGRARTLLERKVGQPARDLTCPEKIPVPTRPSVTCELTTMDGLQFDVAVSINSSGDLDVEVGRKTKG